MDLGVVDGAAPLNLTRPGTMRPDTPAPIPTQPAPQFTRTNAGPMLAQPPAAAPAAPAVDPQQQRMANQTAMYVQGAQAAAAARPASPVQQMVDAPSAGAQAANQQMERIKAMAQPGAAGVAAARSATVPVGTNTMNQRAYAETESRKTAANPTGSIYGMAAPTPAPQPANQQLAQAPVSATGTEAELLRLQGVPVQDPNSGSAWKKLGEALMFSSDKQAMQDKARQVDYGNEGRRTPMPAAAPVAPGVIGPRSNLEAQAKNPASDQGQVPGAAPPMPQGAQPEVGPPSGYTSTSVDGVYRKGNSFTDEAGTRAAPRAGTVSPQNNAAAEALAAGPGANQQALARMQAGNATSPAAQQLTMPTVRTSANDWQARNDLRSLRVSANSLTNEPRWGGQGAKSPDVIAYEQALATDNALKQGKNPMAQEMLQQQGGIARAQIQDEGETARANTREQGANARAAMTEGIQRGELGLKQEAQGFTARAAQRLESAQAAYDNAKTDDERAAAAKRIRAIQGKGEDVAAKDRYITTGGGSRVENGFTVTEPQRIYDTQTRQYVDGAPGQAPAQVPANAIDYLKKNPGAAKDFDAKYGAGAAARYLNK